MVSGKLNKRRVVKPKRKPVEMKDGAKKRVDQVGSPGSESVGADNGAVKEDEGTVSSSVGEDKGGVSLGQEVGSERAGEDKGSVDENKVPELVPQVVAAFDKYRDNTPVNREVTMEEGARQVFYLWSVIKKVLETEDYTEFRTGWEAILSKVQEGEGSGFSHSQIHRFGNGWKWNPAEYVAYAKVMTLAKLTTDPDTRVSALKSIDLPMVLDNDRTTLTDISVLNVSTFYV